MTQPPEPQIRVRTAARLRAGGKTPEQIRALVRRGDLVPVARGVYVRQAVARAFDAVPNGSHVLRAAGAIVLAGPGSVVSHGSAAAVHDIATLGGEATEVTITSPDARRGRRHGVHVYSVALPISHVTSKFGLPVTTPARTVIDLARTHTFAEAVVAADSALYHGLAIPVDLWQVAAETRHTRGGLQAQRVARFADAMAESPLESLARVVFHEHQLPPPELQVPIYDGDTFIGRADFLWRKHRLIGEVDGGAKYTDPRRAKAQLWRDKAMRAAGYEVVHFNWTEITTQPDQVAAAIRAALRARCAGATDPAA